MQLRRMAPLAPLALAASLLLSSPASALVQAIDFPGLAGRADSAVVVRVVNSYGQWNDARNLVFTHYVCDLVRQVSGDRKPARFELRFAGGTSPEGKQIVASDVPELRIGAEYLLFLTKTDQPVAAPIVGRWQGIFRIVREGAGSLLIDAADHLIELDGNGRLLRGTPVDVDAAGRITPRAAAGQEEKASEPVLTDPDGRELPLEREESRAATRESLREPIDLDGFLAALANDVRDGASAPAAE